jgi:hypothetical protein
MAISLVMIKRHSKGGGGTLIPCLIRGQGRRIAGDEWQQSEQREDEIDAPSMEDIQKALQKLKNNESPVTDNIPAELLKHGGGKL